MKPFLTLPILSQSPTLGLWPPSITSSEMLVDKYSCHKKQTLTHFNNMNQNMYQPTVMCGRHQGSWGLCFLCCGRGRKGVWGHKSDLGSCTELMGAKCRKDWNRAKVRFATFPTTLCTWIPAIATSQSPRWEPVVGQSIEKVQQFWSLAFHLPSFREYISGPCGLLLGSGHYWEVAHLEFVAFSSFSFTPSSSCHLCPLHFSDTTTSVFPLCYSLLSLCMPKSPHFHNFQHVEEILRFIKKVKNLCEYPLNM